MNTILEIGLSASDLALAGAKGDDGSVDTATTAFAALERSVYAALETYSNVHRGSGQHSMVSTLLYEQAREIVLAYLGLSKADHAMIFSTPRRADLLVATLAPDTYQRVASADLGLPLGVVALAVARKVLPKGVPFQTGGGTAKLVAPNWVLWAKAPDIFEPGTPAIVNVIAFARALQITQQLGKDAFRGANVERRAAKELLWHDDLEGYAGLELLDQLRQTLIGRDARVPTFAGARPFINLDNGASTPTFRPIWEVVAQTWRLPTPVHGEIIDEVKAICATVLGAPQSDYDVIYTSNTTEAINLVAESLQSEADPAVEPVVINTFLEHNSNELPWRTTAGSSLVRIAIDQDGFIDLQELEAQLRAFNVNHEHGKQRIQLVAVSGASNVLGIFNDLAVIGATVHRYGARFLVDAAQLVAHRPVDMVQCGIDYLVFSAHKAYAPFGAGVLVARKGMLQFDSPTWAQIRASGEANVGGIAALGKALVLLNRIGLELIQTDEQALTAQALRGMAQIPEVTVYGVKDPEAPAFAQKGGVIPFNVKDLMADKVAAALAQQGGIGVRAGCHCAHLTVKRMLEIPRWLEELQRGIFGVFQKLSPPGVVRVSMGLENTPADIDELIAVLSEIARQARKEASAEAKKAQPDIAKQLDEYAANVIARVYGAPAVPSQP